MTLILPVIDPYASPGMYLFTWTTVADIDNLFLSIMYMNEDIIASGFGNGNAGSNSASNTILIHCASGSRVYIQCNPTGSCRSRATSNGLSDIHTFAGFLVTADD